MRLARASAASARASAASIPATLTSAGLRRRFPRRFDMDASLCWSVTVSKNTRIQFRKFPVNPSFETGLTGSKRMCKHSRVFHRLCSPAPEEKYRTVWSAHKNPESQLVSLKAPLATMKWVVDIWESQAKIQVSQLPIAKIAAQRTETRITGWEWRGNSRMHFPAVSIWPILDFVYAWLLGSVKIRTL